MNSEANALVRGTAAIVLTLCACSSRDRTAADTTAKIILEPLILHLTEKMGTTFQVHGLSQLS